MIRCRACGRLFAKINASHLKKSHGITFEDYRAAYPDAPLTSKAVRKKMSEKREARWQEPGFRESTSASMRGRRPASSRENSRRWKDPSYKNRVASSISEAHQTLWTDPFGSKGRDVNHETQPSLPASG